MALHHAAILLAMLAALSAAPAWPQSQTEGVPREACLSSGESRDLFVADKLVPPFRVMREMARAGQAEAIDIQLCRVQGVLVYDVTLLDQHGRLFHRLASATTGAAWTGPPPRQDPAPRPAYQAPRPGPPFYPGLGSPVFPGPRFRPNVYPGPGLGPNFFPGYRPSPPFYPGARFGGRGSRPME